MLTTDPESNLSRLGLRLSDAPKPVAAYVPARQAGSLLFISGQLPMRDGALMATGSVPGKVSVELATECARQAALNAMACAKAALSTLREIKGIIRVGVFVCSEPGFGDQPRIANGASELLQAAFGDTGRHARAAVGSIALPLNAPVEVEVLFELFSDRERYLRES